jgi:hypothetical protein
MPFCPTAHVPEGDDLLLFFVGNGRGHAIQPKRVHRRGFNIFADLGSDATGASDTKYLFPLDRPSSPVIVSFSAIPKLRNNANFAAWKQAVENQLLFAGYIGIVHGNDVEPLTTLMANDAPSDRAGSAPPKATEGSLDTDLTVEQMEEWRW